MKEISMIQRLYGQRREHGFSMIQVILILALISIVTTFGAIGVVKARAQMRLNRSVREFASWAEKARGDSVRRHAMGADRASLVLTNDTTYTVSMDFDRNGTIDAGETQTHTLESGVIFTTGTPTTITFDWRGRSITGEVPTVMAFTDHTYPKMITVTGSGDVTIEAQIFQDQSIPAPTLSGTPVGDTRTDPTPNPTATATPISASTPTPTATPTPDPLATPTATPTATPCGNNGVNCPTPTPTPTATPTPNASPSPGTDPTPYPTGSCTLTASPTSLTIGNKVTKSVTLSVSNLTGSTTVTATGNTNPSHISVTLAPGQSATIIGNGTVRYNVLVNGANQRGTLTFSASSPCGATKTVSVN
jgi:Tfp pilus assembly protein FimT